MHTRTKDSGFTLAELLVVVLVLGIFVVIGTLGFSYITNKAKEGAAEARAENAQVVELAEEEFRNQADKAPEAPVTVTAGVEPVPAKPFNWAPVVTGAIIIAVIFALLVAFYAWKVHMSPRVESAKENRQSRAQKAAHDAKMWAAALAAERTATQTWLSYEKDLSLAMDFPMMRDMSNPLTREAFAALSRAATLRQDRPPVTDISAHPYMVAVSELVVAMDVATSEARRVRRSSLTQAQRRSLMTAERLFAVVQDTTASPNERRMALAQMTKALDGIIEVPKATMEQIETVVARQIEALSPA